MLLVRSGHQLIHLDTDEEDRASALLGGTDELTMNALLNEIKRTRPLSVMRAEHVEGLRAWAKERTRPAN